MSLLLMSDFGCGSSTEARSESALPDLPWPRECPLARSQRKI